MPRYIWAFFIFRQQNKKGDMSPFNKSALPVYGLLAPLHHFPVFEECCHSPPIEDRIAAIPMEPAARIARIGRIS
jgi:hypothetical protein